VNDVNGRCMPPDTPPIEKPAIDEVLGNSRVDRKIRLIAELARALDIRSLKQVEVELEKLRAIEAAANPSVASEAPWVEQKW